MRVFRGRSWALVKFCVCPFFPFGIEGGMWDVIVLISDHCLSIYFGYSAESFSECNLTQLMNRLFQR